MDRNDPLYLQLRHQSRAAWVDWLARLTPRTQQTAAQLGEKTAASIPAPQWLLFLIPDADNAIPEILRFDAVEALVEAMKPLVDQPGLRVYAFFGWEALFTRKPFRYLVHPDGSTYQLFDLPAEVVIQTDHYVGPDPEAEVTSTLMDDYEHEQAGDDDGDWSADEEASDEDEDAELEDDDEEERDIEVP